MKDLFASTLKTIDHNRYTVFCLMLAGLGLVWIIGCQSTTTGLTSPERVARGAFERQVVEMDRSLAAERAGLDAQLAAYNAKVEAANKRIAAGRAHLDQQDAVKRQLLDVLGTAAVETPGVPANYVLPGLSLIGLALGVGASADNLRKNGVIKKLKQKNQPQMNTDEHR